MSYPQIIEYNEAVQDPRHAFLDNELRAGKVAETPLGLPLALSGGFALTYAIQSGQRKYAVRCFHREVPEAQNRYAAISTKLQSLASQYFVTFSFQPDGIRVHGRSFPIVKMDWVEGETLGVYLDRLASNQSALTSLRSGFADLAAYLEQSGIAHGDIQNDNVIVQQGKIRLIDYDGMFVAGMPVGRGSEVGQRNFQHPAREVKHFGPQVDRFSFIVIDISLQALITDSTLHRKYSEGGLAIVFKANDFASPSSSEIFRKLNAMPALRESARKFAAICEAPISAVPTLSDFLAGRNIPVASPRTPSSPAEPTARYLGPFDVVDAQSFQAVLSRVGDKVELIGRIISVKEGIGRKGRGRGRPYVFINFGIWNKESAKVTIWSEGLAAMTNPPSDAWIGKWISVTGLVEPPYEGAHFGRAYRSVGITVTSEHQIVHLTEAEANFRRGRKGAVAPTLTRPTESVAKPRNADILSQIKGSRSRGGGRRLSPAPKPTPPQTDNQRILQGIQTQRTTATSSPQYPSPSGSPSQPSGGWSIPWWVWLIGGIVLLFVIYGR